VHLALDRMGLLEVDGRPTVMGQLVRGVVGQTVAQRNLNTLQQTFNHFLNVLEESINGELEQSVRLFAHFESIDRQFSQLHSTVLTENVLQENQESEFLSNLWNYLLKNRSSQIRKFEKNKQLLTEVRARTLLNRNALMQHSNRLLQMKSNLELLRKKVTSAVFRANESVILPVEEQIKGLEDTYLYLKEARETQKRAMRQKLQEWERSRTAKAPELPDVKR